VLFGQGADAAARVRRRDPSFREASESVVKERIDSGRGTRHLVMVADRV
jgi:hypothetical protein